MTSLSWMTPTMWVAVVGFVITAIVQLSVGYMHRKQVRQVELFRVNQTVGLVPPPNPAIAFLKKHFFIISNVGLGSFAMIKAIIDAIRHFHSWGDPPSPTFLTGFVVFMSSMILVALDRQQKNHQQLVISITRRVLVEMELQGNLVRNVITTLTESNELSIITCDNLDKLVKREDERLANRGKTAK